MKKISLSKETLRVLTAQESGQVAGGRPPTLHPCNAPSVLVVCDTTEAGCSPSFDCPTAGCPSPSAGCTSPTAACPPTTDTVPTRAQGQGGPCMNCPSLAP